MMTERISGTWPLLHRGSEVDALLAAIRDPALGGALVVGAPGQGKTAIAREVMARLERTAHVGFVRGSTAMSGTPFGALNVLLLELDPVPVTDTLVLLRSLAQGLSRRAEGRPVVILVDNTQLLDEESVMVLSYLADAGVARLIVLVDGPELAPSHFSTLWAKGVLGRVDVLPFDFETMLQVLQDLLAAPVSLAAAVRLWLCCQGNARYLQLAVRHEVTTGRMAAANGIWVSTLDAGSIPAGSQNDMVVSTLATLTAPEFDLLSVLTAARAIPLDGLLRFEDSAVVDQLERLRLCAVDDGAPFTVRVTNEVIGDRVRFQAFTNSSAAVVAVLRDIVIDGQLPATARVGSGRTLLDLGISLPDQELRTLVHCANQCSDYAFALRAAGELAGEEPVDVLNLARACLGEGHIREGYDAVIKALANDHVARRRDLLGLQVRLAARDPEHRYRIPALLNQLCADVGLSEAVDVDTSPLEFLLAAGDALAYEGRYRDLRALHDAAPEVGPALLRSREGAPPFILAHSVTGDQKSLRAFLRGPSRAGSSQVSPSGQYELQASLFFARLLAGRLDEALALTSSAAVIEGRWKDAAVAECLAGCALAMSGQGAAALTRLLPAIEQLRIRDSGGLMPLAAAAATYAQTLTRQRTGAPVHSRQDVAWESHSPWLVVGAVRLFSILTRALVEDGEAVARVFGAMADEQRDAGHHGIEMLLRVHAVRLGHEGQGSALLALARTQDSPLADSAVLLASGVIHHDPGALLACAEGSLAIGLHDLAGSAALISMRLHDTEDEPLDFVRAEQIFRATEVPRRKAGKRRVLTERERAFARMAATGATNREIAGAYHLSVRTVEGHVFKAMAKLGISNRKQLAEVFNQ